MKTENLKITDKVLQASLSDFIERNSDTALSLLNIDFGRDTHIVLAKVANIMPGEKLAGCLYKRGIKLLFPIPKDRIEEEQTLVRGESSIIVPASRLEHIKKRIVEFGKSAYIRNQI